MQKSRCVLPKETWCHTTVVVEVALELYTILSYCLLLLLVCVRDCCCILRGCAAFQFLAATGRQYLMGTRHTTRLLVRDAAGVSIAPYGVCEYHTPTTYEPSIQEDIGLCDTQGLELHASVPTAVMGSLLTCVTRSTLVYIRHPHQLVLRSLQFGSLFVPVLSAENPPSEAIATEPSPPTPRRGRCPQEQEPRRPLLLVLLQVPVAAGGPCPAATNDGDTHATTVFANLEPNLAAMRPGVLRRMRRELHHVVVVRETRRFPPPEVVEEVVPPPPPPSPLKCRASVPRFRHRRHSPSREPP